MSGNVVVVGGGPTGFMLASELRLHKVPTILLERFAEPSGYSRSLTLHARSAQVFEQRGLHWFEGYPPVPSYNFGLIEIQDYIDPSLLPLLVPQRDIERRLEERAASLGADIRRGQTVVGLRQDQDGVDVTVEQEDGTVYQLRADYVVGCDGGGSTVRKLAGIGFPGTSSTANGLTADVITADKQGFVSPTLNQNGMFAVVPLGPELYRVTALELGVEGSRDGVEPTVQEFQEKFKRVSGSELGILNTGEIRWLSRFGNATRLADSYREGRVLLAGDSCHIHFPVSGQGLNTGIQDALNLGWKLAAQVNGWATPGLLDTYEAERRPVGARVCWNTRAQDALLHPLDRLEPLRGLLGELVRLEAVNRYLTDMVTGVGIRYDVTVFGTDPGESSLLGRTVPDDVVASATAANGGVSPLFEGRGLLLSWEEEESPKATAADWEGRVDPTIMPRPASVAAAVLLVRPDGYVVHADPTGDPESLRQALAAWFGVPATIS